MPAIRHFGRCRIEMYFADHGEPHFHVITSDNRRASVSIATLSTLAGAVKSKDIAEAIAWAADNRAELTALWLKYTETA